MKQLTACIFLLICCTNGFAQTTTLNPNGDLVHTEWTTIQFTDPSPRIRSVATGILPPAESGAVGIEFTIRGGDGGKATWDGVFTDLVANGGNGTYLRFTMDLKDYYGETLHFYQGKHGENGIDTHVASGGGGGSTGIMLGETIVAVAGGGGGGCALEAVQSHGLHANGFGASSKGSNSCNDSGLNFDSKHFLDGGMRPYALLINGENIRYSGGGGGGLFSFTLGTRFYNEIVGDSYTVGGQGGYHPVWQYDPTPEECNNNNNAINLFTGGCYDDTWYFEDRYRGGSGWSGGGAGGLAVTNFNPDCNNLVLGDGGGGGGGAGYGGGGDGDIERGGGGGSSYINSDELPIYIEFSPAIGGSTNNPQNGVIQYRILYDNTNPVIVCKDATIVLANETVTTGNPKTSTVRGEAHLFWEDVDNGSTDDGFIAQRALSQTVFTVADLGLNQVTYSIIDSRGNTAQCQVNVTVVDNHPPQIYGIPPYYGNTITGDGIVEMGHQTTVTVNVPEVTFHDNGSIASVVYSSPDEELTFTCDDIGTTETITVTATDQSGNETVYDLNYKIQKTVLPIVNTKNVTVNLDAVTNTAQITIGDIDDNSNALNTGCREGFDISLNKTTFSCADLGDNEVVLTINDGYNSNSAAAIVTVRDSNGDTVVPNIVYVDASASAGGNGNSWTTAYTNLQDGIAAANALASGGCNQQNISIHIAEGIYYPDEGVSQTDNDPNAYFSINQINLYGGFPSGGGDINNRNPLANHTILSGDIEQDDASSIIRDISHIQGTNSNKLFESGRSIVDGITFTAGYSNDSSPINFNGGTVNRCEITGNSGYGIGAVDISFSNDTGFYITNSVFANNEARRRFTVGHGGAISARIPDFVEEQQVLHVYNSTFHNNTAAVGGSHFQLDNCQMELVNSIVTAGNDVSYIDFQNEASATISYTLMDRSSAGIADHVLIDDPMYINASNGDFRLKEQSPALNYGEINITGIGTVDFEGKSRNQGCGLDLGAFEQLQTGRILYVNPSATGVSLGNSWDNAYKTIHEALICTQGASEIRVAEGSYAVGINGSKDQHITITMGVKLVGGYYRSETGQWLNDYQAHPSIITGDLNLSGNPDEGDSYTLLEILGDDVTIDGFIFENAFANGTGILPYDNTAAGIYNSGTNLTVQNCIFRKLKSTGEGTAYFHQSGNTSFYNCLFERNESNITGSSFSVQNGIITSVNCTFANNIDGGTGNGATIFVNKGNPAFKNCILYGNTKNVHSLNLPGSIECSDSGSGTPSCIDIGNTSFQNTLYQLPFQSNFVLDNGNNIGVEAGNAGTIFANLANYDYTLTETSEAVNRGLNDELPSTLQLDLAKNKRLNEAVIDIGAYELTDIRCNNAEIIHVNANAPDGGDGLSWDTAFNDLQDALALQCIGMEIWVAQGVYKTSNANEESASFVLPENTILYGGFQGYELELSERDYAQYPTVLSGDLDDSDSANMGDGHTILTIISDNIILDGFVLEYAYADDDSTIEGRMGAGIFSNRSANFNINNCIFRHLIAEGNGSNGIGGAIIIFDATSELTITNGLFHDNTASAYGGALSVESGASLNLINCTLANNDAENNGGGVNTNNNPITIVNTIFASNTSNSGFDNIEISTPTFSHSYLQGQRPSGTGNIDGTTVTDPLFTDVANNDYTLQSSSPLIDKGDNTMVDFDSDLAGEDRKVDFLETATPRVDLGAYELPVVPTVFETISCNVAKPSYTFCYENDLKYRVAFKSISGIQLSLRFLQGAIETNDVINIYDSSDRTNRIWTSNGLPSSFHMVYNFSRLDDILVVSPTGVLVVEIISNDRYSCEESSFNALFSPITFEVGCCETTSRTLFVNAGAPSGGNGLSWGTAFNSLQDAIANVSYCASDEIWVAAGTYKPGNLQTDSFKINFDSGVTILGGFNGTETNASERNWATNPTILSGDMDNSNTANIGDSHTIMSVLGNNVTIDGFIFEYAFADGLENTPTAIGRAGGGLYVQESNNLAVNNCIFRNLIAEGSGNDGIGGAVIKFGSEIVTLTNCLFHDNRASADGGALSSQGGTLNIINCTFAENNSLGSGGAIHNHDTTSNIVNSIFAGNNATTSNPNINANSGSLTINYSYLQNEDRSGEGIGNIDGVTITDPLFTDTGNSDYTLQSTSPLIDVGDNASNTGDRDLLGNDRIVNTIIDLGAYEFGNTPPNAVCKDITIYLDANGRATIAAGEVDNGSTDTEGDVTLSLDITDFDCDNLGENTVIFTVTDANGATATCTTIVTIADNLAPIPDVATLSDIRVQCEAATLEPPTAIDNCGGTITASHDATLPIRASSTIIWTYTDASGNDSTQEQRVIIEDTEAPIPNMATLSDIRVQCEATTLEPPTATDNCGGTITASHDATLPIRASTTIVWTYTDASGNGSTQQQRVIIEDTEAPIPDAPSLPDILEQCGVAALTPPTATDNCSGSIVTTHNAVLPITANTTIVWTYTDVSGNESFQMQDVLISGNCEDGGTIGTKIKISKVVTPNGDGINDYFVVEGIDVTEGKNTSLVVFDRWGNIVYKSDNYQNDWDAGTANKSIQGSNGKVPSGTYFYIISHENNAPIKGTLYVGTK